MHMHRVTHSWRQMPYTKKLPGQHGGTVPCSGVRCLAQGHLGRGTEVDCHPSSSQFTNVFERESNCQPSGYWTTHSNHWTTAAPAMGVVSFFWWLQINSCRLVFCHSILPVKSTGKGETLHSSCTFIVTLLCARHADEPVAAFVVRLSWLKIECIRKGTKM